MCVCVCVCVCVYVCVRLLSEHIIPVDEESECAEADLLGAGLLIIPRAHRIEIESPVVGRRERERWGRRMLHTDSYTYKLTQTHRHTHAHTNLAGSVWYRSWLASLPMKLRDPSEGDGGKTGMGMASLWYSLCHVYVRFLRKLRMEGRGRWGVGG